tara:strand:+ start:274 stop:873 length:600 start_codon:yes stop_codon:yes gene_type:complete
MAKINLTDEEGWNPEEETQWKQYPSKVDTRCDMCWRYLFKGDMIKQRVVNGNLWRAVYCPNAQKEVMHLNTSKEYLMHIQGINALLGIEFSKERYDQAVKEWERMRYRKGYQDVTTKNITDGLSADAPKDILDFASDQLKYLDKKKESLLTRFKNRQVKVMYSIDDDKSKDLRNEYEDTLAKIEFMEKLKKQARREMNL